jgi:hypothetical protein
MRALAQTLAQRAQCYLVLGQPDRALQELTLLNDSRHLLEGAPTGKPMTLVSAMINAAITGLYVDVIADGFRLNAWKEPQLAPLQKELEQLDLTPFLKEAFQEEQVSALRTWQVAMAPYMTPRLSNETLWQKIKNQRPAYILRGFYYFNIINVVKMQQPLIDGIDLKQNILQLQKFAEFQREEDALQHHVFPYKLLAAIAVPNGIKAVQTCAFNQTKVDEAQIVCALERYHLAHNQYPEMLDELVPQFIGKLPHDIVGGAPLKYRSTADGRFLLYSVGWNETDDGGQYYPAAYDKGDWSW